MFRSTAYLLLIFLASETFAASSNKSKPHRRRNTDISSANTITTTILSSNGSDLTSSFQTMLYSPPNPPSLSNLTDRQASLSRPITTCTTPNTTFIRSFCKHRFDPRRMYSLQEYRVHCQNSPESTIITSKPDGGVVITKVHITKFRREEGSCAQEEICVDGVGADEVAHCVSKEYFVRLAQRGENEQQSAAGVGELEGKAAQMIISQVDGSTPLEAMGIDLQAGLVGGLKGGEAALQEQKCRNCFELRTQKMVEGTNFLQTEASLMGAATVAAGMVWLVVSG